MRTKSEFSPIPRFLRAGAAWLVAALVGAGCFTWQEARAAEGRGSEPKPPRRVKAALAPRTDAPVEVTGTLVKRQSVSTARIRVSQSPILIYDQQAIQNSGATTLPALLKKPGASR